MSDSCVGSSYTSASAIHSEIEGLFVSPSIEKLRLLDRWLRDADDWRCEDLLESMWKVSILYVRSGMAVEALPIASRAVRCARRKDDLPWLRKLLSTRGEVHRLSGDLAHALEDCIEAYEVASALGSALDLATALSNLVIVPSQMGLADVSERLSRRALEYLDQCDESDERVLFSKAFVLANLGGAILWTNPSKVASICLESERISRRLCANTSVTLVHARNLKLCSAANRLIAALLDRDRMQAQSIVEEIRAVQGVNDDEQMTLCVQGALAGYEASFGDSSAGIADLQLLVESGRQPVGNWLEGAKLLVHALQITGRHREAATTLKLVHARLQRVRRSVAMEELRRIDRHLPIHCMERDLDRNISAFAVQAEELGARLSAKLDHLERIALTAELREGTDPNRAEHIYRVGKLCALLAAEARCASEIQWLAEVGGRLHDIGKCAIPDNTILSNLPLNEMTRSAVREHSEYGARLIADADEPRLVQVVAAVRHHHERVDGSGYPTGLRGEEIPLLARIIALCESLDAMMQSRSFRCSRTVSAALREIERCAGTQFDSQLAGLFVSLVRRLQREHDDLQEYLGREGRVSAPVQAFARLESLVANTG